MGTKAKIRFEDDDDEVLVWRQMDGYPRTVLNHVHDIIERLESRTGRSPHPPGLAGLLVALGARSPHNPHRDYEDEIEAAIDCNYKLMPRDRYEGAWADFAYDFRCRGEEWKWHVRIGVGDFPDGYRLRWSDEITVEEAVDEHGDIGVEERENAAELLGIE